MDSDQKADKRAEFHTMWTSCVGQPKYDKSAWMTLERIFLADLERDDPSVVKEDLEEAHRLQVKQLELN